ncbi:Casparian strip membrane protein domain-containing protein [Dioscorea alata]|uniref:Casparian strip membrane protein domain-containing protein n=1 Tax=Dioscorea alata TaxID=55571 RepID=A0ACB7WRK3_DIOAL|nr:Casparian strip membrane protein domain-containing protein [Dioscorea alata]
MLASRPAVHPIEYPPEATENPRRVRMKDVQGMGGTTGGLALRLCQFVFAAAALCVMASTDDFSSATAFRYLVAAAGLQSLWSLALALLDIYTLLVKRCLRNSRILCLFTIGDGITCTLTFAAACASAGITVLLGNDMDNCEVSQCIRFETATGMAFLSWFATSPSFFLNFWSLAIK